MFDLNITVDFISTLSFNCFRRRRQITLDALQWHRSPLHLNSVSVICSQIFGAVVQRNERFSALVLRL